MVLRESHCRFCGHLFCAACCNHYMTISTLGDNQRLCPTCYSFFMRLKVAQKIVSGLLTNE